MSERKPRLITRQQPHIETLQVSVQVVRIGPKQMTLAVFRQLKKQDLVDWDTLELRGVPWGTVQYKPGDCDDDLYYDHPHVVWQRGEELRRCCWPRRYWDGPEERILSTVQACLKRFNWNNRFGQLARPLRLDNLRSILVRAQDEWEGAGMGRLSPFEKELRTLAQAIDDLERALPGIESRRLRWQEHVEEIEALPQLFIAV